MNDACLFDNPKSFRREYWKNGVEGYSICAWVIKSKKVPTEFHELWKEPFDLGKIVGDKEHLAITLHYLIK